MLDHVQFLSREAQEKQRHTLLFWFYQFHVGEAPREGVVKQVDLSHSADLRKYCSNTTVWNNCMLETPGFSVVIEAKSFQNAYKKW